MWESINVQFSIKILVLERYPVAFAKSPQTNPKAMEEHEL
jgi:hypothetical protein